MWQPGWERSWGRMDTCICLAEFLHCSLETITTLIVNLLYPNTKLKVVCFFFLKKERKEYHAGNQKTWVLAPALFNKWIILASPFNLPEPQFPKFKSKGFRLMNLKHPFQISYFIILHWVSTELKMGSTKHWTKEMLSEKIAKWSPRFEKCCLCEFPLRDSQWILAH